MKLIKPKKLHIWSFWVPMPLITLTWMYILYDGRMWTDWKVWAVTVPIIYTIGYFSWYGHVQYYWFVTNKFPSLEQTGKRVFYNWGGQRIRNDPFGNTHLICISIFSDTGI